MTPTLTTTRLTMRPFTLGDTEDLFSVRGDPEAMQYWDWAHDENLAQTRQVAETILHDMHRQRSLYWTARTSGDIFAGVFDLSGLNAPVADLGMMVPRPVWGMGYGTEGARAVVAEASKRGFAAIDARLHDGNARSARLLANLGFAEIGRAPQQVRPGVTIVCRRFRLSC